MKKRKYNQNILKPRDFFFRQLKYSIIAISMITISLAIGITGYHFIAKLSFVDSFYNSSMILTGMGPVDKLDTNASKIFSSFYALFSGIAFLSTVAVFFAPIAHRLLHLLHVEPNDEPDETNKKVVPGM